jgi:hypothetical protein
MKNGPEHTDIFHSLEGAAATHGAERTFREYPVPDGFIDLLVERGTVRLACEIEVSHPERAGAAVRKAVLARATALLVVTPDRARAAVARRALRPHRVPGLATLVCTQRTAPQALASVLGSH